MDEAKFIAIFKTGRNHTIQCRECSVKSPPVREGEGVEAWCEAHVCGQEPKPAEEKAPEAPPTDPSDVDPPATDPEPTGNGDDEVLTREGLEVMTKRDIMAAHAPEWDGTKADLIDSLLGENQEEEEEEEDEG